ncbi:hypothetical protein KC318_g7480 [Hortaea werneckii]|uniref:PQ loop repeat protein n=3 Tax=Hortaea werneckii TaxID=91943 RepID=A0A3M7B5X7_HORWE|nr:hypothetical protein KC334_g7667 [Hortaea werneckii]KAI7664853.1 hypothetical protein KC318_g7480 [Hortaea werneckii]RMY35222.1 hypothetical protein D0866_04748 [Hortaea werneckii]
MTDQPSKCANLAETSIPQFIVSCALMVWLLICYLPQWARIISRQSAEGLSTLYVLLGSLSGVCAVGNILMLPSSAVEMGCCRHNTRFACVSGLLGVLQVVFGIGCFWVILFMYVYYSEEEAEAQAAGRRSSFSGPERTFRRARRAYLILLVACAFAFAILLSSAIVLNRFPWLAQGWADILGIAVAVFACVQWVPQTWTTWHLGHLGSLSLPSLCLMAPYTCIFGINMIIRLGLRGWSAWIVYVLVGTMQVLLAGMGISFAVRDRKKPKGERKPSVPAEDDCAASPSFDSRWNLYASRARAASSLSQGTRSTRSGVAPDERRPLLASCAADIPDYQTTPTASRSRTDERDRCRLERAQD